MKKIYQITAAVFLAAFLFSCRFNNGPKVKLIGEIRTRRTFANIQFMDNDKDRDAYIEKQENSNPEVYDIFSPADSMLARQFERLGLIKDGGLILSKFKPKTDFITQFTDQLGNILSLNFFYDSLSNHTHFKVYSSKDSVEIDTDSTPLQNLDYAFLDVIPGGNKELVFLDDYYIMNGFNFDFKVYEIKVK